MAHHRPQTADGTLQPLHVGPMLVLKGSANEQQQRVFYDDVPVGADLLTFFGDGPWTCLRGDRLVATVP